MIGPWDMLALLAVLLFGLPHGAADASLAMQTRYGENPTRLASFMLGYLSLAALMVAVWWLAPIVALSGFLLMTIYHFGRGDALAYGRTQLHLRALLHGGFILTVALSNEPQVTALFFLLTGSDVWPVLVMLRALWLCWLMGLGFALLTDRVSLKALGEIIGLFFVALIGSPLIAFAIYFCLVHSARHFARLAADPSLNTTRHRNQAALLAGISILAVLVGAAFLNPTQWGDGLMQSLFIALAALTVPHMLLVDGFDLIKTEETRTKHAAA